MVKENYACRDSSKRLEFQNVAVTRFHISSFPRGVTSAVRVSFMKAKQRVAGSRGTQLRRFGSKRGAAGGPFRCAASCSMVKARPTERESGGMSLNAMRTTGGTRLEADTIL